jgi:hypothetical protein
MNGKISVPARRIYLCGILLEEKRPLPLFFQQPKRGPNPPAVLAPKPVGVFSNATKTKLLYLTCGVLGYTNCRTK